MEIKRLSMGKKKILASLVFICLMIIIFLFINELQQRKKEEFMIEVQTIINAIYEFEKINDKFPDQLYDITPTYYAKTIPKDRMGKEVFYSTDDLNGFIISYMLEPNYGCGYTNKTKIWECGFGD